MTVGFIGVVRLCVGALSVLALIFSGPSFAQCVLPVAPATVSAMGGQGSDAGGGGAISSARLYLDVSGSMRGFVAPSGDARFAAEPALYPDVVLGLPDVVAAAVHAPIAAYRFGRKIDKKSASLAVIGRAATAKTYSDKSINDASAIGEVLEDVTAMPADSVAVVITDLALSLDQFTGTSQAALTDPLRRILRSGRAVGLLGIRSRFTEDVVDLPVTTRYSGARARPFYLLVIGPEPAVRAVHSGVQSAYLSGVAADRHHFALFSSRMIAATTVLRADHGWDKQSVVRSTRLLKSISDASRVPQYRVGIPATWTGVIGGDMFAADAVHLKGRLNAEVHIADSEACIWPARIQTANLLRFDPAPGTVALTLSRQSISPNQIYLFHGSVDADAIDDTVAPFDWLRLWSVDAASETAVVARRPEMFPTLNLLGVGRTLAHVAFDEFRHSRQPLAVFDFIIKAED